MKERGLPFGAPMVLAERAGRKTHTRRILNPQPLDGFAVERDPPMASAVPTWRSRGRMPWKCPYGEVGDRLYVREAWRTAKSLDDLSPNGIAEKSIDAGYSTPWAPIQYEADGMRNGAWPSFRLPNGAPAELGRYRHARFMPRWASRTLLEVTEVRVERLQDISEADALAEGLELCQGMDEEGPYSGYHWDQPSQDATLYNTARDGYCALWESLNGPGSWAANPWVWVIEFRRLH